MQSAVDLFAGPGGWDVAARELGIDTVGIEWDDSACATRRAAQLCTVQGDVRQYGPGDLPSYRDGLIASPPCQTFSMAGGGAGRRALDTVLEGVKELAARQVHAHAYDDERTALVLEPLRWALAAVDSGHPYRWLAFEQVPAVLLVWEAMADALRAEGYAVATGKLSAEQYGVPQTRKRAVLIARLDGHAAMPLPSHSRYHNRTPSRLDAGVPRWVTMAEALGWGATERPAMTVTGGGAATGGAEPFGNAARQGLAREREAGRWVMCSAGRTSPQTSGQVPRDPYEAPSATLTGKGTAAWVHERPATTVQGDPRIGRPGHKHRGPDCCTANAEAGVGESMFASGSVRVSVEEAAALQTFPAGYPWQGNSGKKYQQVGNAVPPLLARAILTAATR